MANQRFSYKMHNGNTVDGVIQRIEEFLINSESMETQRIMSQNDSYTTLQARARGGKLKQFVGMDKAITIRFIKDGSNSVTLEIGEAKWADKGAAMAVSMFVLWPLAVTSGIGIYQQQKLPSKIKKVADQYFGVC